MGSAASRAGSGDSRRAGSLKRRKLRRTISSIFVCGACSSRQIKYYSSEHGRHEKLKFPRKFSSCSLGNGGYQSISRTRFDSKSEKSVTSNEMEPGPSQCCDDNFDIRGESSEISEGIKNASSLDEASVQNNCSEDVELCISDSTSSGFVAESRADPDIVRDEIHTEENLSEREQIRLDRGLLHEARLNSRRLFWDAFPRHNWRIGQDLRTVAVSPGDSDRFRSQDRWVLDFGGSFSNEEIAGDLRFHSSRASNTNEPLWSARPEIWERIHEGLGPTDRPGASCPRGMHADGSCSCISRSSNEESSSRAGISRIIMLAEALFEVLDQIHQQPMSVSLSMVSHPAPASTVDSFPVKTYRKPEQLDSHEDVSQCYICLAEYVVGESIRVLPCHHEYHMLCVDKWLKDIHGVCPLCRRDVRESPSGSSITRI